MRKTPFFVFLLFMATFFFASCDSSKNYADLAEPKADEDYVISLETRHGTMTIILFDETPLHKRNFINLVRKGFYEDLLFHRVIKDFVIQGGDPKSAGANEERRLGNGDPGYSIPAEIRPQFRHEKGALSAARIGNKENPRKASNGSQFYIVQGKTHTEEELNKLRTDYEKVQMYFAQFMKSPKYAELRNVYNKLYDQNKKEDMQEIINRVIPLMEAEFKVQLTKPYTKEEIDYYTTRHTVPSLDGEYTVFGKVIKGLDVIDKIANEETKFERPAEDVKMNMVLKVMKKTEISTQFGYTYP